MRRVLVSNKMPPEVPIPEGDRKTGGEGDRERSVVGRTLRKPVRRQSPGNVNDKRERRYILTTRAISSMVYRNPFVVRVS